MKKILFVATITGHFYYFHLHVLKYFKELGWQVDVAAHGDMELPYCDNRYEIPIARQPFDKSNVGAYKELKRIIGQNDYDIIHCHTPMGGVLARLAAAKQRKRGTKVIYTAHGFHFFKGASALNWLIYYPIEKVLSKMTDCLITINSEDYDFARKHLKAGRIEKVNGVGYNDEKYFPFSAERKEQLKAEKGFNPDEKLLIYVAELNENKNQGLLIDAVTLLREKNVNVKLLLAGTDNCNGLYREKAESKGVSDCVGFLGQRDDIDELLNVCDVAVASSLREGLPVNVMEALACGLPVVATDNRGHRELIKNGENGFLVSPGNPDEMASKILELLTDSSLSAKMSEKAAFDVRTFSKTQVLPELIEIYNIYTG